MTLRVKLDAEYWVIQDNDELWLIPALVVRSGGRSLSARGIVDPPPFAVLPTGTVIVVDV